MHLWVAVLLAASPSPTSAPASPRCVEIVGTNDLHGHLEGETRTAGQGAAGPKVEAGGLATFGGYLSILRKHYPGQVLLLDAGDLFQGTLPSNFSKGAAVIAAYNLLGYQAASLGNHEFDFGADPATPKDLLGTIKRRLRESSFPFLASNVYEQATGKRVEWPNLHPSVLLEVGGLKVGVIGAVTPETPFVTLPGNVKTLDFKDPAQDVLAESKALKAQGAQLIVLVGHIGAECGRVASPETMSTDWDDLSSCEPKSEILQLIDHDPKGTLDVAVAGHTHMFIAKRDKGVAIQESGSYGKAFGWIEACVDAQGKVTTQLHPSQEICAQTWAEGGCAPRKTSKGSAPATFLGDPVVPDPRITVAIEPYLAQVRVAQEAPVGVEVVQPLKRAHDRLSPLGVMVAEGIRRAVPGAQIGLSNAGGIRADIPEGKIKFRDVFEVLPFDNLVVGLKLTGKELKSFIVAPLKAGHGFPQLTGARLVREGDELKLTLADGSSVKDDQYYLLATNDFLANGGDGAQPVVAKLPMERRTETEILVRDSFIRYLKSIPGNIEPPKI